MLNYYDLCQIREYLAPETPQHVREAIQAEVDNYTVLVFEHLGPTPGSLRERQFRVGVPDNLRVISTALNGAYPLYRILHGETLTAETAEFPNAAALWRAVSHARDAFALRCPALSVLTPWIVWRGPTVRFEQPPWDIRVCSRLANAKAAESVRR